jgi:hypothetical protein
MELRVRVRQTGESAAYRPFCSSWEWHAKLTWAKAASRVRDQRSGQKPKRPTALDLASRSRLYIASPYRSRRKLLRAFGSDSILILC